MEGEGMDAQAGRSDVPPLEIVGAHSAQTLREVALRFIAVPRWGYARWEHTELLPGRLPPGSPPIPLPDGVTLFGSCVRESGVVTDIYIDAGLPPTDIYKLYHDRLLAAGWHHDEARASKTTGVKPEDLENGPHVPVYLWSDWGPSLDIDADPPQPGGTEVHLILYDNPSSAPRAKPWGLSHLADILFHRVAPPCDGRYLYQSARPLSEWCARLEADGDLVAIAAHYIRQLQQIGWTLHAADQQGALAWSTWTAFRDENFSCQVLLTALEFPWADRQYRVSLTAAVVEAGTEPHWMPQPAQRARAQGHFGRVPTGSTDDVASLLTLLKRAIPWDIDHHTGRFAPRYLYIAQLPPRIAVRPPLPEGYTIVGSRQGPYHDHTEIVLSVNSPTRDAVALYRRHLSDQGWQRLGHFYRPSRWHQVFDRNKDFVTELFFVRPDSLVSLYIAAGERDDGSTDLHLSLGAVERTDLTESGSSLAGSAGGVKGLFPALAAPAHGHLDRGYASPTEDIAHADVRLSTDDSLPEIVAYYADQLHQCRWRRYAAGNDGTLTWSTWIMPSASASPALGWFLILRDPFIAGHYHLTVQVQPGEASGGTQDYQVDMPAPRQRIMDVYRDLAGYSLR